eukprot:3999944-Pleurochrysis_carterae.AAC.1
MENVFGEFWRRSCETAGSREEAYEKMVSRVNAWSQELFNDEANILTRTYLFFEDDIKSILSRWQSPYREDVVSTGFVNKDTDVAA